MRYFRGDAEQKNYYTVDGETVRGYAEHTPEGWNSTLGIETLENVAAFKPDTDGEITESQALAIRAGWNQPTPSVDPDTARKLAAWDGLVAAMDAISREAEWYSICAKERKDFPVETADSLERLLERIREGSAALAAASPMTTGGGE